MIKTENKRPLPALIHLVAWGILFGMPFFFTGRESQTIMTLENYIRFMIVPLSFMVVFYVNYFVLVNQYIYTRRIGRFILWNLLLIFVLMVGVHLLMQMLPPPEGMRPHRHRELHEIIGFFTGNVMLYMLVAGLSVAIKMTGGWYQVESARKELEKSRAEAELQNLKSQLNPHFLFNTLNNIYSLIAFSPEKAQEAVHDLSRLLRYVLYESSQPMVPLEKELDFIRNYVELMRIRLPENIELKTDIKENASNILIAPLLFISLIENAFKHGVSNSRPSFIHIKVGQIEDTVYCSIRNSYFPKDEQDKSGSGIGLVNLRKRLELLYPGQYMLKCELDEDAYSSCLTISTKEEDK